MSSNPPPPQEPDSPHWDKSTKMLVIAAAFVLTGLAMWQFQSLISTLIIAAIIAYILDLPIVWLESHTRLTREQVVGVVFSLFALIVIGLLVAAGVTIFNQGQALVQNIEIIIHDGPAQLDAFMNRTVRFGTFSITPRDYNIDLQQLLEQTFSAIQGILGTGAEFAGTAATTTVGWIGNAVFIYVISVYFALELPSMADTITDTVYQPGYRRDLKRLLAETGLVWNSYLRGQTTLALIMAAITTVLLSLLGVNNALALGILTGMLDFIPFLGPGIAIGVAVLVALFQDSNWLGLSPMWFGVVVLIGGIILQQIEGNWLSPRIVGGALGLHPLLVMLGAIIGGTLLGLVGVMLAAPVMATVKVFGTYTWRKLFDRPPFPPTPPTPPTPA